MASKQPDDPDAPSHDQIATAWHESGHAVMAMIVGRPVLKVTISPANLQTGGVRLGAVKIQKGRSRATNDSLEDEVLILLAGMVAESHFTDKYCRLGAGQDLRSARRMMQARANSQRQMEKLERRLIDKTEHLLSQEAHAAAIQSIARELLTNETISGRSVRHLFNQAVQKFGSES